MFGSEDSVQILLHQNHSINIKKVLRLGSYNIDVHKISPYEVVKISLGKDFHQHITIH